jgi:hypothetical protein
VPSTKIEATVVGCKTALKAIFTLTQDRDF